MVAVAHVFFAAISSYEAQKFQEDPDDSIFCRDFCKYFPTGASQVIAINAPHLPADYNESYFRPEGKMPVLGIWGRKW